MTAINNKNLKLAMQKEGRLTEETLEFLRKSGLEFESYNQRLFSTCRNFPLEILYVRDDDIPDYVASGTVDLGILGQNILSEERPKVKKLLNLRFGFCTLFIAVPKESQINNLSDLNGKTIATTYPNSTQNFLLKNKVEAKIVTISGSVEITPALGVADAISDLLSTGSTLALNDLRPLTKVYDSEAILIANEESVASKNKMMLLNNLLTRFKGVLSAKNYKYILMSAPEEKLTKIKKMLPSLIFPTLATISKNGFTTLQTVIKEDVLWDITGKLKAAGISQIFVLPIEKIIS
ncbi:MAG: ATP phosphoribosyltransferase [Candidatus Gottesmanbacteria bacterium]|nr:ATP phosphoribosyltransferase [Candidatus Gottesmanbacteria bacterium]